MGIKHREDSITGIRLREAQKTKIAISAKIVSGAVVLELPEGGVCTGTTVKFTAPCSCDQVTHGIYIDGNMYKVVDAMHNSLTGASGVWQSGAVISVVLDCMNMWAILQTQPLTTIRVIEATLSASKWNGSEAPYTQTVAVDGMDGDTHGIARVNYQKATLDQRNAARYAMLCLTAQGTNTVTITADGECPTIDIPIIVRMDRVVV